VWPHARGWIQKEAPSPGVPAVPCVPPDEQPCRVGANGGGFWRVEVVASRALLEGKYLTGF